MFRRAGCFVELDVWSQNTFAEQQVCAKPHKKVPALSLSSKNLLETYNAHFALSKVVVVSAWASMHSCMQVNRYAYAYAYTYTHIYIYIYSPFRGPPHGIPPSPPWVLLPLLSGLGGAALFPPPTTLPPLPRAESSNLRSSLPHKHQLHSLILHCLIMRVVWRW